MALQFMEGFDTGNYLSRWTALGAYRDRHGLTSSTRFGVGNAYYTASTLASTYLHRVLATPASTIILGCAIRIIGLSGDAPILYFLGNSTAITVTVTGTSVIRVANDAHTFFQFGGLGLNQWHYLEIKATIHATSGNVTARLDGVEVGVYNGDTRPSTGVTDFTALYLGGIGFNDQTMCAYDDIYICDSTGAANNDFLGDVRVQTLLPTGAGSSTQLTPTGGANYANVSEMPDSTATYNSSSTVGDRDTYAMADLSASTGPIYGVQNSIVAWKSDAGTGSLKTALKSGASVYYDATQSLGSSPMAYLSPVRETNPATSTAWTVSDVNNAELGVEVA